ncbi:hypothetical protein [Bradyrhizobium sp. G127]|uniref:hypothetical protein n=1 Tax=Bradyrhizobium sp. G127 TaxID=2904800 RepID=UPI001F44AA80|nr:hypothetical protein [Bradyrhizobium sp. G127]MCF2522155.1 hypothetical protein [Bradyrhizobium sp. G127]
MPEAIINESARQWFSIGLGGAFVFSMAFIFAGLKQEFDAGWLGLIFLLNMIFYLIAFSFLVAATTPGSEIKIAVAVVDGLLLIAGKMFSPTFLDYLADDGTNIPLSKRGPRAK